MKISKPIGAKITLSEICNHRCTFCYNKPKIPDFDDVRRTDYENLSTDDYHNKYKFCKGNLKKLLNILAENEIAYVKFTGGEPFMTPKLLFDGLKICKKHNIKTIINTNLTIFDKNIAKRLVDCKVNKINITLVSHDIKTYNSMTCSKNYNKVIKNIKLIKNSVTNLEIGLPVTQMNLHQIYDTIKFINEELGINKVSVFPAEPTRENHLDLVISRNDLEIMFEQMLRSSKELGIEVNTVGALPFCCLKDPNKYITYLKAPCRMGIEEVSFALNGDIKACSATNKIYGNLFDEGYKIVMNIFNKFLSDRNRKKEIYPQKCKNCAIIERGSLGCKSANEFMGGGMYTRNRFMSNPFLNNPLVDMQITLPEKVKSIFLDDAVVRKEGSYYFILTDKTCFTFTKPEFELIVKLNKIKNLQNTYLNLKNSGLRLEKFLYKLILLGIIKV